MSDKSEEKKQFKSGDVVRLKSGGPKMTVHATTFDLTSDLIDCRWFHDGEIKGALFFPETLQ